MFIDLRQGKSRVLFTRKTITLVLLLFLLSACNVVRGSGNVVTESRTVSNFNMVSLSGPVELIVNQGEGESLEIEAEDNIIAVIETEVRGDTLEVDIKENTTINPTEPVRLFLTMRDIHGLEISGSGNISVDSMVTDRLSLGINGSGDIKIGSLSTESLTVDINGSGNLELSGQATSQVVGISGSGKYQTGDLESEVVDVVVNGAGEVTVWATDELNSQISGSGTINYYGSPTVSQDISGSGEINSLGAR